MEKTVVKAIELVETLARMERPVGVTTLAQELGLTKSNVFRLLNTLVAHGYVRRFEEAGQYELTLKVWHLGVSVLSRMEVKKVAMLHIERLMQSTMESVHLSVFADGGVVYIDKIESEQPVRAYSRVGDRPPAHCVATGKVLLAHLPEAALDSVLKAGLARYTPQTITNERALRKELELIRRNGYSTNRGEWRESVCGVGAPIRDWSGAVAAAVGISGPSERLRPNTLDHFAPQVISCAAAISRDLGYRDVPVPIADGPAAPSRPRRTAATPPPAAPAGTRRRKKAGDAE